MQVPKVKSRTGLVLFGAGLGLATAFLLDPVSGKRRRARLRDRSLRTGRDVWAYAGRRARDLSHRVQGRVHDIKHHLTLAEVEVDDFTLVQRVRSCMGHEVSHARSVQVEVKQGTVTLSGPVLSNEVDALVTCVERVPGVKAVQDRLDIHESAEHIPGLQGLSHSKGGTHGTRNRTNG